MSPPPFSSPELSLASDNSLLYHGVLGRMMITRVISGACESINSAIVELYCVESSPTPSLGSESGSDTNLALSMVVYFLYLHLSSRLVWFSCNQIASDNVVIC